MLEPVAIAQLVTPREQHRTLLLDIVDIVQRFKTRGSLFASSNVVTALAHVSLQIHKGETLGVVGESGCGKTTLARAIMQMPPPISGEVWFQGWDLTRLRGRRLQQHRSGIQMIFQDPYGSLNPRWRVFDIVQEPLICGSTVGKQERRRRAEEVLAHVGLAASYFGKRFPGELSGGQCQRVAIARSVINRPALLICDEAVSSLDALVQKETLELLRSLRDDLSLSYLFISHDLLAVTRISDRVAVLHSGQLCEVGPADVLSKGAAHPYTRTLFASVARTVQGHSSSMIKPNEPTRPLSGCRFRVRCPAAQQQCASYEPQLKQMGNDHFVACHFPQRNS